MTLRDAYTAPVSEFTTPGDQQRERIARALGWDPQGPFSAQLQHFLPTLGLALGAVGSNRGAFMGREGVRARTEPDQIMGGNPRNEPPGVGGTYGPGEAMMGPGDMGRPLGAGPIYPGFLESSTGLASRNWYGMHGATGRPSSNPIPTYDPRGWNPMFGDLPPSSLFELMEPGGYAAAVRRQQLRSQPSIQGGRRDFRRLTPDNEP